MPCLDPVADSRLPVSTGDAAASLPLPSMIAVSLARMPRHFGIAWEFVRYFLASAAALGVDVGLFTLALRQGALPYSVCALIGFTAGAAVAYLASVRWVFDSRSVRNAGVEFGVFVAIGAAGLLLTEGLLWLFVGTWQWPAVLSKLSASGFVFVFNFAVRKLMLFRPGPR